MTKYSKSENKKQRYKTLLVHRIIMKEKNIKNKIDHIDSDNTLDNRKCNLRITFQDKNMQNRNGKNSNNTSGYRNVCWNKQNNKWMVQLQINGKNKLLGMFENIEDANRFAEEKRKEFYKEFAGKN
jgi:hypothetical protein